MKLGKKLILSILCGAFLFGLFVFFVPRVWGAKLCLKGSQNCAANWGSEVRSTSGNGRMCISGDCAKLACVSQAPDKTCTLVMGRNTGGISQDCPLSGGYTGKCINLIPRQPLMWGECEKTCGIRWVDSYCEDRSRSQSDCGTAGTVNTTYRCTNSSYLNDEGGCKRSRSTWHDPVTIGTRCENASGYPSGISLTPTGPSASLCVIGGYCDDATYLLDQSGCTSPNGQWVVDAQSCSIAGRSTSNCGASVWHNGYCSDGSEKTQSQCASVSSTEKGKYCFLGYCVASWPSGVSLVVNGHWSDWGTCTPTNNIGTGGTKTRSCVGQANGGADCSSLDGGNSSTSCTMPDDDGDGIRDDKDWCPSEYGQAQWTGCAYSDPEIYGAEYRSSDAMIHYNARGDSGKISVQWALKNSEGSVISGPGVLGPYDKKKGDWVNYTIYGADTCEGGNYFVFIISITPDNSKRTAKGQASITMPCGGVVYPKVGGEYNWRDDCKTSFYISATSATKALIYSYPDGRYYRPHLACGSGVCVIDEYTEQCGDYKAIFYNENDNKNGLSPTYIVPFKINDRVTKSWECQHKDDVDWLGDANTNCDVWGNYNGCNPDIPYEYSCIKKAAGICQWDYRAVDSFTCRPGVEQKNDSMEMQAPQNASGTFPLPASLTQWTSLVIPD